MPHARKLSPVVAALLFAGCSAAGGDRDGSSTPLDSGSSGNDSGGFVLDGALDSGGPAFDTTGSGDVAVEECRIATLGNPGSAGVGDVFAAWLDKSGGKAASNLLDQTLTASLLAPYKMIVSQNVSTNHDYSLAEVAVLHDWVNAGGGLMTLTGYADSSEVINVNRLLAPYALNYGSTGILYGGGHTLPVTNWVPHPVTTGITRIGVDNGYEAQGGGTMLASEGGSDVLRVEEVGSGHVVVWGDEWITYNSEWTAHPDYQVQQFWQNIVDWFMPTAHCKVPDPPK
jgi:hypothetical protein